MGRPSQMIWNRFYVFVPHRGSVDKPSAPRDPVIGFSMEICYIVTCDVAAQVIELTIERLLVLAVAFLQHFSKATMRTANKLWLFSAQNEERNDSNEDA